MTSVQVLMQLDTQNDWVVHQLDVKRAYVNASINSKIFTEEPENFEVQTANVKLVWKLKKSIYGLHQSGRNWNTVSHEYLVKNGFTQSPADPCMYKNIFMWRSNCGFGLSWWHLSGSCIKCVCEEVWNQCFTFFFFLWGKSGDDVRMNQSLYLEKLLKKFGKEHYNPRKTSCEANLYFSDSECEILDVTLYQKLTRSLN